MAPIIAMVVAGLCAAYHLGFVAGVGVAAALFVLAPFPPRNTLL